MLPENYGDYTGDNLLELILQGMLRSVEPTQQGVSRQVSGEP